MELIATTRFAVFGPVRGPRTIGERTVVGGTNSGSAAFDSNSSRAPGTPVAGSGALEFEADGIAIEIPSMRLRELNTSNASRYGPQHRLKRLWVQLQKRRLSRLRLDT